MSRSDRPSPAAWSLIQAERAALADDLEGLADWGWLTPSLCDGLSVRQVLAHLTAGAGLGPLRWMAGVIRCRFDFDRQGVMRLEEHMGADPAETLASFRRVTTSTTKPPVPVAAMLGEAIVHGEDIRQPLGIRRAYPIPTLTAVAEYLQRYRPPRVDQAAYRGPSPRRDRRSVRHRRRTECGGKDAGAGHGDGWARRVL